LVTIIGLGYFVLFATVQLVADWLGGTIPFFDYYHVPFIILFLVSILLVLTKPRIGYLVSIIVGPVAVAIFTPFTFVKGLSSPADILLFVYVMTVFPLILAAVSYSAMDLLEMRKPARANSFRFSITPPHNCRVGPGIHNRRIHCGRIGSRNRKPASLVCRDLRRHYHSPRRRDTWCYWLLSG
jgi:hypothetical protein